MSEEQLNAFLAKLQGDTLLQAKLEKATNLEATLTLIKEAGFDVSKDDWLSYEANQSSVLDDDSLDDIQGGISDKRAAKQAAKVSAKASSNVTCTVTIH